MESLDNDGLALVVPQDERQTSTSWAVVVLDRHILVEQLIPAIIEQNFGAPGEREYDVWMVEDGPSAKTIYASNAGSPLPEPAQLDIRREISGSGARWIVGARHDMGSLDAYVTRYRRRNLSLGLGAVLVLGVSFVFLTVATRRAEWLAERQIEFVAGVSHELRTPLAGISSLSQNLADGIVDDLEQAARYGETINHETRRLNEMIEKVLQFSAIRSGEYRYDPQPVDLQSLIMREREALRRFSGGRVRPSVEIDDDLPLVMGDEQALRSVVRNLVSNAVKFGGEDSPVCISARRVGDGARASHEIELSVKDRGPGIGPSELKHIFNPFFRGQGALARQIRGSGLGLSLVREIVQAHRGRVEVTSEPGIGSTFRVYLPLAPEEAHDDAT
jgi:signal transduction histidine kinase